MAQTYTLVNDGKDYKINVEPTKIELSLSRVGPQGARGDSITNIYISNNNELVIEVGGPQGVVTTYSLVGIAFTAGVGLDYDPLTGILSINPEYRITRTEFLTQVNNILTIIQNLEINDLTDIDTATWAPMDGDTLVYIGATGKWEPKQLLLKHYFLWQSPSQGDVATILRFPKANNNGAELSIFARDLVSKDYHACKMLVVHKANTANGVEYAVVHTTPVPMFTVDVDVDNTSDIVLRATATDNYNDIEILITHSLAYDRRNP